MLRIPAERITAGDGKEPDNPDYFFPLNYANANMIHFKRGKLDVLVCDTPHWGG